jgi:hypothetical protein
MIASGGVVYFSNEKLSWGWGDLGTWRKDKETVLEGFPDNYSRTGYKCDNCNAILIEGRPSSTQADKVKAAQAEVDKVNLQNRIRRI